MAQLNIDNLITSVDNMLSKDIISLSNQIKERYIHSNVYQQAKISSNFEILNLNTQIESELVNLEKEFNHFYIFLKQYLHDYIAVEKYLSDGSQSEVISVPTFDLLKSSLSLKNNNLKPIKLIDLKLIMDYENSIVEKDGKHNE